MGTTKSLKGVSGKTWLWAGAILILVAGAILVIFGLSGEDEAGKRGGGLASPVVVQKASPYLFADIIEAIGTARANESVTITAQVSDTVKTVHFADGGTVEAGTILVTLNNAEELANVSAALASYTEARQKYDRTKTLVDQGNLSQAALDAATRAVDEATGRLDAVRARAGDYVISAPFAGMLGLRQVSPGTLVSPGTAVTTLDDISIIKLDFAVPERFISAIRPGQEIAANAAAYKGLEFRGLVTTLNSRVDPITRAITVRAEIANPDALLRPGMLLTVDLVSNLSESISVAEKALIPVGEKQFVFRINPENKSERIEVQVGRRYGDRVEVLGGLKEGDLVVTAGALRLRPGGQVTIQREEPAPEYPDYLLTFMAKSQNVNEAGEGDDPF
ncbi:MAG: efflux RND transporter periplasmic adaptor subunit [Alphaproteobacteria bacterium]